MANRIEIRKTIPDAKAIQRKSDVEAMGFSVKDVQLIDVYTINTHHEGSQLEEIADMLTDPVIENTTINQPQYPKRFDWAIEIGFLPGVTDNVGTTVKGGIQDKFREKLGDKDGAYDDIKGIFMKPNVTPSKVSERMGELVESGSISSDAACRVEKIIYSISDLDETMDQLKKTSDPEMQKELTRKIEKRNHDVHNRYDLLGNTLPDTEWMIHHANVTQKQLRRYAA